MKTGYKKVIRYFQITKKGFKYFNSVFSSSVWNDKPLFRTNIWNIADIKVSNNDTVKIKFSDVKLLIEMHFTVNEEENENILELGWSDSEVGISTIKILIFLKKYYSKF